MNELLKNAVDWMFEPTRYFLGFCALVAAVLYCPSGIASGPDGSVYVSDYYGYRIVRLSPSGVASTFVGNGAGAVLSGLLTIVLVGVLVVVYLFWARKGFLKKRAKEGKPGGLSGDHRGIRFGSRNQQHFALRPAVL